MIGLLDRPSSGRYRLDGEDVSDLSEAERTLLRRERIGFVFQSFHMVPRLDAAENVAFPMVFAGIPRAERQARAAVALAAVGLAGRAKHRPAELSGGERQRVSIARATVMRPRVLLADEPTGNLDSAVGAQVMELLERLNADGLTLLVVTHDPGVAARAQRTIAMRDGRITERRANAPRAAAASGAPAESRA
jgi:putative ABC transport system ATP-binding protein